MLRRVVVQRRHLAAGKRLAIVVVVALAIFAIGIVIATVGNFLRDSLCIGGESECTGATPLWRPGGTVLYYAGTAVAFSAPLAAAAVWWRLRARRRPDRALPRCWFRRRAVVERREVS